MQPDPSPPSTRSRHYERLMWVGYAMMGLSLVVLGFVAAVTLRETVSLKDELLFGEAEDVLQIEDLRAATELESRKLRSFLLSKDERLLDHVRDVERQVDRGFERVRSRTVGGRGRDLLERVLVLHARTRETMERAVAMRRSGVSLAEVARYYDEGASAPREQLDEAFDALEQHEKAQFEQAKQLSVASTEARAQRLLGAIAATAVVAAGTGIVLLLAFRALRTQQRALDRYVQQTAKANRDLDAFAGRIAHDLKNVVAPLPLIARLLREQGDGAAGLASQRVERVATRSIAILDALLAFARAGRPADTGATSSIQAVLKDVIEDLRPATSIAEADVVVDVEPLELGCSPGLLSIVLGNVLGNALKFLQDRPVRRVTVEAHRQESWAVISVSDTGPGIPKAMLARIFEPFYRVPGSTTAGSGIGLATVQRIVDAHGGKISVESVPEQGATFRIWLPLAPEQPSTPGLNATAPSN